MIAVLAGSVFPYNSSDNRYIGRNPDFFIGGTSQHIAFTSLKELTLFILFSPILILSVIVSDKIKLNCLHSKWSSLELIYHLVASDSI